MMIFTDRSDSDYSDFGSSDDDSVLTEDEEEDSDISDDEEVVNISQAWRRGRLSTSTSGEWSRLYTGLQKWHSELSNERRQCVGLLTKPYRR